MFRGLDSPAPKVSYVRCDRCGKRIVLSALIRHARAVIADKSPTATAYNVCHSCETSTCCLTRTRWRYDA